MRMRTSGICLGLIAAFLAGYTATARTSSPQSIPQLLVEGHGRANSSSRPPGEPFILTTQTAAVGAFRVVPPGKKFILTDIMYIAQGSLRQDVAVNIASADTQRQRHKILLQVRISPGESDDVHLCSGYVIPAGHSLVAFTNADVAPQQYVSVAVTGYLADE